MESLVGFKYELFSKLVNNFTGQTVKRTKSFNRFTDDEESLFLTLIPREVHFLILSNLTASDLINVTVLNKEFKELVEDNTLWKLVRVNMLPNLAHTK